MKKPFDIIAADRNLAHALGAGTTFEERARRAALHRENHSVMAGEHIGQDAEDLIVMALRALNRGDAEDLAKEIEGSMYLVKTPFSQSRAAEMVREREQVAQPQPYSQTATFTTSERAANDARSFREQVALDAMKIMLAQGFFSGTPDVDAEKCWQLADELLEARERIDSGQAAKDAAERESIWEAANARQPDLKMPPF